jgi:putative glycerol-1-phosphate prenyltransferase
MQNILSIINKNAVAKKKSFALLLDPDKFDDLSIIENAEKLQVDYFFVGGSLITEGNLEETIKSIKSKTTIPVIIFPGSANHITSMADGILLLSLLSGRNADYLIGQHIQAAPVLKKSGLEILSTGYILIDGGNITTVAYISNTTPIPSNKPEVAVVTAMAGEMIGHKLIYLDAGSGAIHHIYELLINMVKKNITIPLIVGGGIRDAKTAEKIWNSGADIIVVGNAIEKNSNLLHQIIDVRNQLNS